MNFNDLMARFDVLRDIYPEYTDVMILEIIKNELFEEYSKHMLHWGKKNIEKQVVELEYEIEEILESENKRIANFNKGDNELKRIFVAENFATRLEPSDYCENNDENSKKQKCLKDFILEAGDIEELFQSNTCSLVLERLKVNLLSYFSKNLGILYKEQQLGIFLEVLDFYVRSLAFNKPFLIKTNLNWEARVIEKFVYEFGLKLDIYFDRTSDFTILNLMKLLKIMSLNKALFAIRATIKNAFSYGKERSIGEKGIKDICVNNLNKLYSKYTNDAWSLPRYEIDYWELEENYNVLISDELFRAKILQFLDSNNFFEITVEDLQDLLLDSNQMISANL